MKVTIKKTHENDGYWFKVIDENGRTIHFYFDPTQKSEAYNSEANALQRAIKLAKDIEGGSPEFTEEIIYETGKNIDPLAYFMAANMSEEEIQNTIGNDLTKLDDENI